jgi:hypothetical protein
VNETCLLTMAATTAGQVRFVRCALELRGDILRRLKIRTRVRVPLWGGDLPRDVRPETHTGAGENRAMPRGVMHSLRAVEDYQAAWR